MEIVRKETDQRMSSIVIHNGTAYFCGQVAKDNTKDITEQTKTTLEEIDDLLASINADRTHILSTTIYLKDMKDYDAMNKVWDNWVPKGHAPARACVQAQMAEAEYLIEMSVIAAVN